LPPFPLVNSPSSSMIRRFKIKTLARLSPPLLWGCRPVKRPRVESLNFTLPSPPLAGGGGRVRRARTTLAASVTKAMESGEDERTTLTALEFSTNATSLDLSGLRASRLNEPLYCSKSDGESK